MDTGMKILIAYDGSHCADAALEDLRRAGLPSQVQALVISVAETWLPPPPPSSYQIAEEAPLETSAPTTSRAPGDFESPAIEEARTLAAGACERLQKHFPGWEVSAAVGGGSPAWEVIMKADAWKPDLIVVGSQGRSAFGRFVLGSVSQKIITEARSSVRVARGNGASDGSPLRNVIGVDGSPSSQLAVRAVAGREWPAGTEVFVVAVEDVVTPTLIGRFIPPVTGWVEESNRQEHKWAQKIVEEAMRTLTEAKVNASPIILDGDPKRVLIKVAEERKADCIFVGSTGQGNRFARFLLGSVSGAVAARAHCSVEVVR